jgi:peptide/nickel transport system substrate-binding protein
MRRARLSFLLLSLLAVFALVAAGCGGDDDEGGGGGDAQTGAPTEGKQGGDLTFLAAADVDYLDPGQSYYTFGYQVLYATNRPLYSFSPDQPDQAQPDLAEGDPQISEDNKTITVKLKTGIKYAPPVNREVTSEDVKYAMERAFSANVPSGYATSYFADITGAPDEPTKGVKPIEGIETPDPQTLVINLDRPTGQMVAAALVMPITVPVPEEYAKEFDAKSPTEYDQYVAFTGPYMVKNDPETGEVTGRDPGKRIEIVRNPNWDKATDYRPAYLDSITIEEGNDDLTVASRRTLQGESIMCCDSGQPPIPVLRRAITQNKDQIGRVSGGGTRWIALRTDKPPFDNINMRKAVIAGMDRDALRLTRGGEFIGPIANHFIPPGIPGFEESGGEAGFSEFDWMANPKGDQQVMQKYLDAAEADGVTVPNEELLTIATNADPGNQTAQVFQGQIQKMGFRLNYRKVPQDTLYTKFCSVPKSNYVICPNVGWFKDFTDPQSLLEPTFKGDAIKPQGNVNWSMLDNDEIDQAMDDAALIAAGPERNQAWADINKMIVEQAVAIPYSWDDNITLWSKNVDGAMNAYFSGPDFTFTTLK